MKPATRKLLTVTIVAAAALVAVVFYVARWRDSMRLNRLTYLVNDHQFNAALEGYIELRGADPELAGRLPQFETITLDRAEAFYRAEPDEAPLENEAFTQLLANAEQQTELAAKVRAMRLRLALDFRADSPETGQPDPVGVAAAAILEHDGYVLDALYWVVASRYKDTAPLEIPPVVLDYREKVEAPLPAGEEVDPQAPRQRALLLALLALSDRNWGGAVYEFERLAALGNDAHRYELAYGSALLRSGEYAGAVSVLQHYHRLHPERMLPVREWAAAAMRGGDLMMAASVIDRLHTLDKHSVASWIDQWLPEGLMSLTTGAAPGKHGAPMLAWVLMEATGSTGKYPEWLTAWLENQPGEMLPRYAGELLAVTKLSGPQAAAALNRKVGQSLSGPQLNAWQRLADALGNVDRTPMQIQGLLKHESVNELFSHQTTFRRGLKIDPRASYLVLQLTGYPADGVWPLVHLDGGPLGEQQVYVRHGRGDFMPVVFPIQHPVRASMPDSSTDLPVVEISYTHQNGDWTAEDQRNLLIVELFVM